MLVSSRSSRSGFALVAAAFTIAAVASLATVMMAVGVRTQCELESRRSAGSAFYLAEAGLTEAIDAVRFATREGQKVPTQLGAPTKPHGLQAGSYWATIVDHGDGTFTLRSTGQASGGRRAVEATLVDFGPRPFDNAVYAGNSSGDPLYMLELSGQAVQADSVVGDIYSGAGVHVKDDATVSGQVRAVGSIVGATGFQGPPQPLPDIAGMNYDAIHDIDVAGAFAAATYQSNPAGGSAWELPVDEPAHIFRKNPSDRSKEFNSTLKDDYFLEDPHEPVHIDPKQNGSDAYHITLTGDGNPGPKSNEKVFFIDGNLWLHNLSSYSLKFYTNGQYTRVTFVVKGNVYFSDNLFYQNKMKDGVAFIAMKDPNDPDSGNIYFGDPEFGTLREMHAFMYAENDFYDYNLDASGSAEVHVHGAMTAGNLVDIQRDYKGQHSRLSVNFDDRLAQGDITLPGLPPFIGGGSQLIVASWREVAVP